MRNKKGQAAMEFLMTYGWAILAAIVVIGVLAVYFKPSTLTQDSFIVTAPLYGVAISSSASQIQIEVKNQGGETITTTNATITFNSPSGAICADGTGVGAITASGTQVIAFSSCTGLSSGDRFNADVAIEYTRSGSTLSQKSTGSASGSVA